MEFLGIRVGPQIEKTNTAANSSGESKIIEQLTQGDNSPAVSGVGHDVHIGSEQKK